MSIRSRLAQFPHGVRWEITEERAREWVASEPDWLFAGFGALSRLGPLDASEFYLLRLDILAYRSLLDRAARGLAPHPGSPAAYLRPGREEWGALARLCRLLENSITGAPEPEPSRRRGRPRRTPGRRRRRRATCGRQVTTARGRA